MAETGHAKNVSSFALMIALCTGYGGDYDPTNAMIQLGQLNLALTAAQAGLDDVQLKIAPWKNGVADRENIYAGIRPRTTQILAAFDACGADKNKVDNLRTYHRQVHGARATALPEDDPGTPENEAAGNSVAHLSYVQIAEAFGQILAILAAEPLYIPNETHLTLVTNTALHAAMEAANVSVTAEAVPLSNSRISRNEALYADTTGILDRAALVKKYVKSLYGATSPQYAQVSGLEFKRR